MTNLEHCFKLDWWSVSLELVQLYLKTRLLELDDQPAPLGIQHYIRLSHYVQHVIFPFILFVQNIVSAFILSTEFLIIKFKSSFFRYFTLVYTHWKCFFFSTTKYFPTKKKKNLQIHACISKKKPKWADFEKKRSCLNCCLRRDYSNKL